MNLRIGKTVVSVTVLQNAGDTTAKPEPGAITVYRLAPPAKATPQVEAGGEHAATV